MKRAHKPGVFGIYRFKQHVPRLTFRPRFVSGVHRCSRCSGLMDYECLDTMRCLNCGYRLFAGPYTGPDVGARFLEERTIIECGVGKRRAYATCE